MRQARDRLIIEPAEAADASVIWLHGLGADGHDFEPIVPELGAALTRHTRFVFPHAPERPVTVNGGYVMRAWYDVTETDLTREPDAEGIRDSARILDGLVAGEVQRGIAPQRIVLAGFSQGGAVALHAGLRQPHALAGILALSTYLPLPETLEAEASEANGSVSVFMGHGIYDPVIPESQGEASRALLEDLGYAVEWHSYPIEHTVSLEEIRDVAAWLSGVLR